MRNLVKTFSTRSRAGSARATPTVTRAVDDVSFDIQRGECFGLVGESGCGKTTVSKIIMRAVTPDERLHHLRWRRGADRRPAPPKAKRCRSLRTRIQMVFQDPFSSLSPRMTVQNILSEPLEIHDRGDRAIAQGEPSSR